MDDDALTGASRRPARPPRASTAPGRRRGSGLRRPGWLRLPRNRIAAAVVIVALVATGLVASLGAGYTVAKPLLGDASTYVGKGNDLAHANAETGKVDAQSPQPVLPGGHTFTPIQLPDGSVVAVDDQTGQVVSVDGTTLQPTDVPVTDPDGKVPTYPSPTDKPAADAPAGSGTPPQVIVSGGITWYVDLENGRVARFSPGGVEEFVGIDGGIASAQPGPGGTLVVLTRDEAVVQVSPSLDLRRLEVGGTGAGTLTVANGHVYLVTSAGKVLQVDGDAVQTVGVTGVTGTTPTVPTWRGSGRYLLEVDPGAETLVVIDTVAASTTTFALKGAQGPFGPPAQLDGRAYVPDFGTHQLLVIELATGKSLEPVEVTGTSATFDVWVASGRVWANDQNDRRLVAINPNGDVTVVDKGTGGGVTDSTQDEPDDPETPVDDPPVDDPPVDNPPVDDPPVQNPPVNQPTQPTNPTQPTTPPVSVPAPPTKVVVPAVRLGDPYEELCAAIEAVQLTCSAVPGGADLEGDSGDSATIDPKPGTEVVAGTTVVVTYVGELEVPSVTGQGSGVAKRTLAAQGLKGVTKVDPQVVDMAEVGTVTGQKPSAGESIEKGGTVTISVPNSFALTDYAAAQRDGAAACAELQNLRVTCKVVSGSPATANKARTVEKQEPGVGAAVKAGDTVTLTVYSANTTVGNDYTNKNNDTAFAACTADGQARGYTCASQQGDNNPDQAQSNVVYGQTPPAGTAMKLGGQVVLTFYHYVATVPPIQLGVSVADACALVTQAGLACNQVAAAQDPPNRNANPVVAQNPAPQTQVEPGSAVDVSFVAVQAAVELWVGSDGNGVNVARKNKTADGYGQNPRMLGYVYPGAVGSGTWINGYFCTSQTMCGNTHDVNHFYSNRTAPYKDWNGPNQLAFTAPCAPGTSVLWRVWSGNAGDFDYNLKVTGDGSDPRPGMSDRIGCVWN